MTRYWPLFPVFMGFDFLLVHLCKHRKRAWPKSIHLVSPHTCYIPVTLSVDPISCLHLEILNSYVYRNMDITNFYDSTDVIYCVFEFLLFCVLFFSRQITNGLWPTTWSNLLGAVVFIAALLYAADFYKLSSLQRVTGVLWKVTYLLNLDEAYPYNFRLIFVSVLVGVVFFVTLLYLRQYTLRMLLAYRQWMCKLLNICSFFNTSLVPKYQVPNLMFQKSKVLSCFI